MANSQQNTKPKLTPYLSPNAVWSLALGTAIGWGSLVVTSNNYLSSAGPMGSVLGILIGAAIMIVICKNYYYMINCYPDAGGSYAFAKEVLGYDQGFLTGWFLELTYISIFWANATSLPLFARYFFGNIFRFGYMYSIFGYDVYIGEALLTIAAIIVFSLICMSSKKAVSYIMIGMAILFTAGISVCFFVAMFKHGSSQYSFNPLFTADSSAISQVIRIVCISPWAFIGFENISHASEEFSFSKSKTSKIMISAVLTATALYVFITLLSVTAYPSEYGSWLEYIRDLGNLEGIKGLPAFYAANYYMGNAGITILVLSLLALIITSLIGNMIALSRLNYVLAKDDILPSCFADLNKKNIPWKAIVLVGGVSIMIPFLGRTAIGWIVDVTTIGATIIYGFVSASAMKLARVRQDKPIIWTGLIGMGVMIGFGLFLLVPELFAMGSIEKETYFLFTTWAVLGFVFFRYILKKDREGRFGKSIVVWIALLSLILFTSLVWLSKSTMSRTAEALSSVKEYYGYLLEDQRSKVFADVFMEHKMIELRRENVRRILVVTGFFAVSIFILLNNYTLMKTRMAESEKALERAKNMANLDSLTGVKSKRAFVESEKIINEDIAAGIIIGFSIVVCDLNGLKHVNDTFGHKAGDEYIRKACKMICDHFLHSPVFRIGGDEFAVIVTGEDYINRRKILNSLDNEAEEGVKNGGVVVSVGMSDYIPNQDKDVNSVFERADALMYVRKKRLKEMGAKTRA